MSTIDFEMEWLDKRRDGTPFEESWVRTDGCNLPVVWQWLMKEVVDKPAIGLQWDGWVALIKRKHAAASGKRRRDGVQR